jgi:hypothetical protein
MLLLGVKQLKHDLSGRFREYAVEQKSLLSRGGAADQFHGTFRDAESRA